MESNAIIQRNRAQGVINAAGVQEFYQKYPNAHNGARFIYREGLYEIITVLPLNGTAICWAAWCDPGDGTTPQNEWPATAYAIWANVHILEFAQWVNQ